MDKSKPFWSMDTTVATNRDLPMKLCTTQERFDFFSGLALIGNCFNPKYMSKVFHKEGVFVWRVEGERGREGGRWGKELQQQSQPE